MLPTLLLALALSALLTACDREAPPPADPPAPVAAAPDPAAPAPTPPADRPPSETASPSDVALAYFRRIQAGDYAGAYALWADGGKASGMSEAEFAHSFDKYGQFVTDIGGESVEGAAGSLYAEVQAHMHGRLKSGEPFNLEGPIQLRRVNDVPGATPEQLRWHIIESGLKPRPGGSEQTFYVGRWAASPGLCANGAWDFTTRGVKTAGEVSCTFDHVADIPGGVEIDATCTAESPPMPATLRLRYAESAKALLVEGGPFTAIGLTRCTSG